MPIFFRVLAHAGFALFATSAFAIDGSYDPTFANIGREALDVTSLTEDRGQLLRVLPDGTLFMAGGCSSSASLGVACAAWLRPNGTYASGFGPSGAGTVRFDEYPNWPADAQQVLDAQLLADGRMALVVGTADFVSPESYYLAIMEPHGASLDSSVGLGGVGYQAIAYKSSIAVRPNGKLVLGGSIDGGSGPRRKVVSQLLPDFTLDSSFGDGGVLIFNFDIDGADGYGQEFTRIALQRDGKVLVVGAASANGASSELAVARLTTDGHLDLSFGPQSDGRFHSTFGGPYGIGFAVLEDPHGRILFGGVSGVGGGGIGTATPSWIVGRLLANGTVDPGFTVQRFQILASTNVFYRQAVRDLAVQSDGRVVAGGNVFSGDINRGGYFGAARFNDDGGFDGTFGFSGVSYGDMSGRPDDSDDSANSMVLADGGLFLAGSTSLSNGSDSETRFSIAKLTIDLVFANGFE